MAEDDLAPTEELAPDVVPDGAEAPHSPDQSVDEPKADDAPLGPVESLAQEFGWEPKDRFKGNPEKWRPADEYLRAGRNTQRNLTQELREVRSTVENMSRTTAQILQDRLDAQRMELEAKFNDAVEKGDAQAAFDASTKMSKLTQPATAPRVDPTVENFVRENEWFNTDPAAHAVAVTVSNQYAHLPVADQLQKAREAVHKRFPEYAPQQAKQPAQVRQPGARTASTSSRAKGFHDLPPEAQKVAKDMHERGVIPTLDDYVSRYFAQPERKVG